MSGYAILHECPSTERAHSVSCGNFRLSLLLAKHHICHSLCIQHTTCCSAAHAVECNRCAGNHLAERWGKRGGCMFTPVAPLWGCWQWCGRGGWYQDKGDGDTIAYPQVGLQRNAESTVSWFAGKWWKLLPTDSYFKAKMHQIRFRLGLRPIPSWGAYSAP